MTNSLALYSQLIMGIPGKYFMLFLVLGSFSETIAKIKALFLENNHSWGKLRIQRTYLIQYKNHQSCMC